ncbi:EamA family transporter [Caproiciproducens sp. CPB-2]|uniref:EamA family transporter n=1 Tax=Caproiciproducens sp. CPB-2 TaxID=3030017 RepID=UPI0023D9AF81|nr:EamA family transporter [Caproiciproducens sp. CPB-2]MDF1493180.1 EamA family transporter [Caproiciproducens sp. CPB-2]
MQPMKPRDKFLALLVVVLWGINFTVIKFGVSSLPPMLLVALRYIFAAVPAVFFVKRPDISWKYLVAYGLTVGVGQFSCLFYAEHIGMPAGVASVMLQSQALFTILLAGVFFRERIRANQAVGLFVAAIGLVLISGGICVGGVSTIPSSALALTLLAAFFWGISNIVVRRASDEAHRQGKNLNMFSLVVWSSLVPPLPMLAAAFLADSPTKIWQALYTITPFTVFSILYLSLLATLFGYGVWSSLLSRYPAGKVAPLSLLVPVFGLITAWALLKEQLSAAQWVGCAIAILGLILSNHISRKEKSRNQIPNIDT